jgi:thioredoxin-dependent peroxiredoxin
MKGERFTVRTMTTFKKGDKAPAFALPSTVGKTLKLANFKGRKLLIYFFPKAGTSG